MSDSQIDDLRSQFDRDLAGASSEPDLRAVRDRYLSRKGGLVSTLLKSLGAAPAEERPRLGRLANELREDIDTRLTARLDAACSPDAARAVDVTLRGGCRDGPAIPSTFAIGSNHLRAEGFLIIEGTDRRRHHTSKRSTCLPSPRGDMQDTPPRLP